eukprot:m.59387 g.59387  ORF g.59387 m.59387 type:complete len:301 (+) comp13574_c0_seq1:782-1684(+)
MSVMVLWKSGTSRYPVPSVTVRSYGLRRTTSLMAPFGLSAVLTYCGSTAMPAEVPPIGTTPTRLRTTASSAVPFHRSTYIDWSPPAKKMAEAFFTMSIRAGSSAALVVLTTNVDALMTRSRPYTYELYRLSRSLQRSTRKRPWPLRSTIQWNALSTSVPPPIGTYPPCVETGSVLLQPPVLLSKQKYSQPSPTTSWLPLPLAANDSSSSTLSAAATAAAAADVALMAVMCVCHSHSGCRAVKCVGCAHSGELESQRDNRCSALSKQPLSPQAVTACTRPPTSHFLSPSLTVVSAQWCRCV